MRLVLLTAQIVGILVLVAAGLAWSLEPDRPQLFSGRQIALFLLVSTFVPAGAAAAWWRTDSRTALLVVSPLLLCVPAGVQADTPADTMLIVGGVLTGLAGIVAACWQLWRQPREASVAGALLAAICVLAVLSNSAILTAIYLPLALFALIAAFAPAALRARLRARV